MTCSVRKKRRPGSREIQAYVVVYRKPGFRKQYNAGSFEAMKDARERRNKCIGWLAAGLDPKQELKKFGTPSEERATLGDAFDILDKEKIGVEQGTRDDYKTARKFWCEALGEKTDPFMLTREEIQQVVTDVGTREDSPLARETLRHYLKPLKMGLDKLKVSPNPARDGIELPKAKKNEKRPPTRAQWMAAIATMSEPVQFFGEVLEALGLRISEGRGIRACDIDLRERQVRINGSKTDGSMRWVPCPDELLAAMYAMAVELGLETERLLFSLSEGTFRKALSRAEQETGHKITPHLLRHRRLSLWVCMGITPIVAKQWAGHVKAEMTLDTYGHVVDVTADPHLDFFLDAHRRALTPKIDLRVVAA